MEDGLRLPDMKFKASHGWFEPHKKHANLSKASINAAAVAPFPTELQKIIDEGGYSPKQDFNVDETSPFWNKMPYFLQRKTGTLVESIEETHLSFIQLQRQFEANIPLAVKRCGCVMWVKHAFCFAAVTTMTLSRHVAWSLLQSVSSQICVKTEDSCAGVEKKVGRMEHGGGWGERGEDGVKVDVGRGWVWWQLCLPNFTPLCGPNMPSQVNTDLHQSYLWSGSS